MKLWYFVIVSSVLVLPISSAGSSAMIGSAVNDLAALLEIPINFPRSALVNKKVDELFAAIRINVSGSGLDPLPLPTDSDDFNVTIFDKTLFGSVSVSNTRLGGLSTIHRTGDCDVYRNPLAATIYVGGNDILFGVDVALGVGILNAKIKVTLFISHVDLMISVAKGDQGVVLNDLRLNEIGRIKFSIEGIPGGGSEMITNRLTAVSNLVKDSLTYAFQEAIKKVIVNILEGAGQ